MRRDRIDRVVASQTVVPEAQLPGPVTYADYARRPGLPGSTRVDIDPAQIQAMLPRVSPWRTDWVGWVVRKLMALQEWAEKRKK